MDGIRTREVGKDMWLTLSSLIFDENKHVRGRGGGKFFFGTLKYILGTTAVLQYSTATAALENRDLI